jgi:UDP-2,3-diacylglucosamine pyrophosphatase LpxH
MFTKILDKGLKKVREENASKYLRALIIPDCHIPFEDKRAYDLMLKVACSFVPEEIVILGDYADFWDISSHAKELDTGAKLVEEIDAVQKRLEELRLLFPESKIVYIEGNHEYRLGRYVRDKARELYGIVDVPKLLKLDDYNIKFVPYGPHQKYNVMDGKLIARHEPIAGGIHCAHGTVAKACHSVIFGHVHRIQESQIVSINGENYRGITPGWLGDQNSSVFNYVKNHHQWALGFSVVTQVDNEYWFNQTVHIIDYKCQFDGKVFRN